MKQELAFIDHSFHQQTKASSFLIEILKKEYEVELFWDESWQKGARVDLKKISRDDFNTIVFFQVFRFPAEEIASLKARKVILVPMYDAAPGSADFLWKNFTCIADLKFINFSKTLHKKFTKFGFKSRYFQYFLPPDNSPPKGIHSRELKGFFWQRTERITWDHIRKLIQKADFKSFNLHWAIDPPGYKVAQPDKREMEKYNIKITKWFPRREEYLQALRKTNVFFAPRAAEGIGMSFLEALASGKCVAAPDRPTMNEYIRHGVTGLLYNPARPKALDFSNIDTIYANVKKMAAEGYKKWQKSRAELLDMVRESPAGKDMVKPLKLRAKTDLYFSMLAVISKLKGFIKKALPCSGMILPAIKRFFR